MRETSDCFVQPAQSDAAMMETEVPRFS